MMHTLKLLLPALLPSWRFFEQIAPSPRMEFTVLNAAREAPGEWQEFRPRPAEISYCAGLKRLFWNPKWNESLFLVSCAERLIQNPTEHSLREIVKRIRAELARRAVAVPYLQFRLVFLSRDGKALQKHILFVSDVYES